MNIIYTTIKVLWRLLKAGKTLLLTMIITISIILNIAQFTGGALAGIFDAAMKSTTGISSASSKNKAKSARLSKELFQIKSSIKTTTKKISRRSIARGVRIAAAGVTQTAGSWVPYLGTVTGAAFIAYEAHDLCQSFNELHELQQLASLAETNNDYVFCGYDFNG